MPRPGAAAIALARRGGGGVSAARAGRDACPSRRRGPCGRGVGARGRRRVPAAERREELIAAAVHEFARGGLHGTPVDRIARRVGVAQPYVFSLFAEQARAVPRRARAQLRARRRHVPRAPRASYREGRAPEDCEDVLQAMGRAYRELLQSDRDYLMLQHQSYAACDEDEVVRERVRHRYAEARRARRRALRRRARAPGRLLPPRHGAQRRRRARRRGAVDRAARGSGRGSRARRRAGAAG